MKQYLIALILIATLFLANSCKHEDEMLEKDKAMLKEKLSSTKVVSYKAVKVLFRSANFSENEKAEYKDISELSNFIYDKIINVEGKEIKMGIKDYYHVVKEYHKVKEQLLTINEDDLPTILEVIVNATNSMIAEGTEIELFDNWCASYEHLALSVLMKEVTDFTYDFSLYEASLINSENMANNELKSLALMYQGMIYIENDLNFLAEDVLVKNIEMLQKGKIKSTDMLDNELFGGEKQIKQLEGISYMLLGLAHNNMLGKEFKQKAIDDFNKFQSISEENGLNNELSNIAGIYVYYKKGDLKTTKMFFDKLKQSNKFDKAQRKHIDDLIDLVDKGGELRLREDLISVLDMKGIFEDLISSAIKESSYFEELKKSEAGETLFELPDQIYSNYHDFKDLKEKGKEYLNKVKGLFE